MAFKVHAINGNVKIVFEGDIGIDQAHDLWEQLLKAEVQDSPLTLDAGSCGSVDFSLLQLLLAARVVAKSFVIEAPSAAFIGCLDRAGVRRLFRGNLPREQ